MNSRWQCSLWRFIYQIALAVCVLVSPTLTMAACTSDLPGRGVLDVYAQASGDAVIGGIGANQCGLEVTDLCTGPRCLAFFDGLSGYIEVTGLASGSITPAPSVFEYQVTAVSGSLTFMGRTQPLEMAGSDRLLITPKADHVLVSLPDPLPKKIRMTSTGASGWEVILPDWVGVPVPVTLYLDRLSAPRASLEMLAEHQMLKMDMRLTLERIGDASQQAVAQSQSAPAGCEALVNDIRPILRGPPSAQRDAILARMLSLGITSVDSTNPKHCAEISAALER